MNAFGFARRSLLGATVFVALTSPVSAQDACSTFKWPVTIEREWFVSGKAIEVAATARLSAPPTQAMSVTLARPAEIKLAFSSKRAPKDDSGNAVLAFDFIGPAGRYQVTLSDDAWVDIIQNGSAVPSTDFSGVHGCPDVRKSVKFDLQAGEAILQIASSPVQKMLIAIRRSD